MANPDIKIMACSNVYIRLMHFQNKGDVEVGHSHTYDHATVLSNGSVRYEVLDSINGKTISEKVFNAPDMIFVEKNKFHRIVALEENTVCSCTHAIRSIDEDLIPPDSFIETKHKTRNGEIRELVEAKIKKPWSNFTNDFIHDQ